jgi:hypothetical protein
MNTWKRFAGLVAAGALALAIAAPAMAGVEYATVTGHTAFSNEANEPGFWGEDCTKLNTGEGDLGTEQDTYVLGASYELVVVKTGSGEFANTEFANASEGETVWADTNGNNVFDEGDQAISHIIFCNEVDETPPPSFEQSQEGETDAPTGTPIVTAPPTDAPTDTPTDTPTDVPSFFQSQEGQTDAPSEPDTATITTGGPASPADSAWLLVVALGVLLASVVVLTPARAKSRR